MCVKVHSWSRLPLLVALSVGRCACCATTEFGQEQQSSTRVCTADGGLRRVLRGVRRSASCSNGKHAAFLRAPQRATRGTRDMGEQTNSGTRQAGRRKRFEGQRDSAATTSPQQGQRQTGLDVCTARCRFGFLARCAAQPSRAVGCVCCVVLPASLLPPCSPASSGLCAARCSASALLVTHSQPQRQQRPWAYATASTPQQATNRRISRHPTRRRQRRHTMPLALANNSHRMARRRTERAASSAAA